MDTQPTDQKEEFFSNIKDLSGSGVKASVTRRVDEEKKEERLNLFSSGFDEFDETFGAQPK